MRTPRRRPHMLGCPNSRCPPRYRRGGKGQWMRIVRRRFALGAVMLTASVALGACGGEGTDSAASSSATTQASAAPEDTIAPDAAVGAGLGKPKRGAAAAARAPDGDAAKRGAGGAGAGGAADRGARQKKR